MIGAAGFPPDSRRSHWGDTYSLNRSALITITGSAVVFSARWHVGAFGEHFAGLVGPVGAALNLLARSRWLRKDASLKGGAFQMNSFRTPLIATAILSMNSCAALAQVRIITPDSEHLYSADPRNPGQLPDDETLRVQNERSERARILRAREREQREIARQQEELLAAEQARQAAQAAPIYYESVGSYGFVSGRHVHSGRHGAAAGNSSHHGHAGGRRH